MRAWSICRQELRMQLRSTRFRLLLLAAMLLAAIAAAIGARDFAFRKDQYEQRFLAREEQRASGGKLDGWEIEPTLRILREPQRASIFVRGLDAVLPPYWDFSPSGVVDGPADPSIGQDSEVGEVFDLESVFRIVLGLMALMLAVDSVAGQRAAGTLHALMLQPVSRGLVVACKCLAGSIALLSAIVLVTLTGVAVLYATTRSIDLQMLTMLCSVGVIGWIYLISLFGIGLAVGGRARTPERAAFAGIAIWVFVAFVAPQLVAFGVRGFVPVPPRQAFEYQRRNLYGVLLRSTEEVLGRELPELSGKELTEWINRPEFKARIDQLWRADAKDTRGIIKPNEAAYADSVARQQSLTRWLARLSPGSLLIELSTDFAGTGRRRQAQWQADAEAYQDQLNTGLFDDRAKVVLRPEIDSGKGIQSFLRHPQPRYSDLPAFSPSGVERPTILEERTDVAALLGFVVVGIGLGLASFPRNGL